MELTGLTYFTADVPSTTRFYERLTGSRPVHTDGSVAIFDLGGVDVLIHETYDPAPDGLPPSDHAEYAVDDVDDRFATLVDDGIEPFREPADDEWGRTTYLRDPDERIVELVER